MTYIYLKDKDEKSIKEVNQMLSQIKLPKQYRFYSEKDVKEEYKWFKKEDGEFPEHSFPRDKIKSYEDFKKYWNTEAIGEVFCPHFGTLKFDHYYGRTTEEVMTKIGKFIINNISLIEKINNTGFVERTKLTKEEQKKIVALDDYVEPEMLPEDKRTKKDLQSGQWLCKSFSPEPFWVIYGNVDTPTFLKEKIYVDDIYNNIYRDKKHYAYLLMPLMPLDAGTSWFEKHFDHAWQMGLREHPYLILPILYNLTLNTISDETIKEFNEFYTPEEIKERFNRIYFEMESTYGYNNVHGFVYKGDEFVPCGGSLSVVKSKCQVLTILLRASGAKEFVDLLKK